MLERFITGIDKVKNQCCVYDEKISRWWGKLPIFIKIKRPKLKRLLSKKEIMVNFIDRWVKCYVELTAKLMNDKNLLQSLCNTVIEKSSMIWLKILQKKWQCNSLNQKGKDFTNGADSKSVGRKLCREM